VYLHIHESTSNANDPLTRRPADNRPTAIGRVLGVLTQTAFHEAVLWRPLERALARVWFDGAGRRPDDRGVLVPVSTWWRPGDWGARLVRFRAVFLPTWGESWLDAERRRFRNGLGRRDGMSWTDDGQRCVVRPPDTLRELPETGWFAHEADVFVSPDGPGEVPGLTSRVRSFEANGAGTQPSAR
jgi:hypothetical protein